MDAGVRIIHVDVMDGHFVPNITIGPPVVESLAPLVHGRGGVFSVHLMIEHPEDYLESLRRRRAPMRSACTWRRALISTTRSRPSRTWVPAREWR